jgi:hypothetical protein
MGRLAKFFKFFLPPRLHESENIRMAEVWESELVRKALDRCDKRPLHFRPLPPESIPSNLGLVKKPVVFWTPVEEENANERMWEFRSEDH